MRYVKESRIAAPPDEVFRFHESPGALTALMPPWDRMRADSSGGSLRERSRVVLKGRAAGLLPVTWAAVRTEYEPPHLFADRQEPGPFAAWYPRHRFLDDGAGGTLLRDEVEYTAPLGWLGKWLGDCLIRSPLERLFAYRHETTRRLVGSGSWKAPGPPP